MRQRHLAANTPEYRKKLSQGSLAAWQRPEYQEKQRRSQILKWEKMDFYDWLSKFPPEKQWVIKEV